MKAKRNTWKKPYRCLKRIWLKIMKFISRITLELSEKMLNLLKK